MRSAGLKYLGAVIGIIGFMGVIEALWAYVWQTRSVQWVDFNDFVPQLAICGIILAIGILMYAFIDE